MGVDRIPGLKDIITPFGLHTISKIVDGKAQTHSYREVSMVNIGFNLGVVPFVFEGYMSAGPTVEGLNALGVENYDKVLLIQRLARNRINAVTPFDLEKGYQITPEDYDQKKRGKKLEELRRKRLLLIEGENEFPLQFVVSVDEYLEQKGLVEVKYSYQREFKNALDRKFIERLRLQVSFPNWLRYESRPEKALLADEGCIAFDHFYPLALTSTAEPGPLAGHGGGVEIMLPDSIVALNQIQARFILLP